MSKSKKSSYSEENPQGRYWIATFPHNAFYPYLFERCVWMVGQIEKGAETGYLHWQVYFAMRDKVRLFWLRDLLGPYHYELTRSDAAIEYCRKGETAIAGTQFELGKRAFKRNSKTDWDGIKNKAKKGKIEEILDEEPELALKHYFQFRAIAKDFNRPKKRPNVNVNVYWGATGSGKSYRAFEEAGDEMYRKSSSTKWWDGYRGETNVVIDEFDGRSIGLTHLLQWFDNYPMCVEIKGGNVPLAGVNFWITSNIDPNDWYKEQMPNPEHLAALRRRFSKVIHFTEKWGGIMKDKPSKVVDDLRLLSRIIKPVDEFGFTQVPNFTQRLEGLKDDKCSNCFRELCFNFRCLQEGHDSFYGKLLL